MNIGWRGTVVSLIALILLASAAGSWAQSETNTEKSEQEKQELKRRTEAVGLLNTLSSLLSARREQMAAIEQLKLKLQAANEDATKKELEQKITEANTKLDQVNAQTSALSSGVSADNEDEEQGVRRQPPWNNLRAFFN